MLNNTNIIMSNPELNAFLTYKYQYKENNESLRQAILLDIEEWFMKKIDQWEWAWNSNYRKSIKDQIKKVKLEYYIILINQSGLDNSPQYDLILKYKTGRTENEWKDYVSKL
jgi:hypothetical protein